MGEFEKLEATIGIRRYLRVVQGSAQVLPEQETLAPPTPLRHPLPERQRREPQSFERFRRANSSNWQEGETLPAMPAPYVPHEATTCPMCKGRGFMRSNVPYGHPDFGKPVACQCIVKQRMTLFGGAHIPDDFHNRTFATYLKLPLAQEQKQVVARMMRFMAQRVGSTYAGEKRGLYLYGSWGTGKTGLAIAALCQAIEAGHSALYLPTSELFSILYEAIAASQRLARGYGDQEDKQEESAGAKVLRLVETVAWLVLDDLGVECGSAFVVNHLYRIIEERRSKKGLYTIFTSNKDAAGLEQRWRPAKGGTAAFDDCYRVIERLGEYCVVIPVIGRNLRQK